MWEDTMKELPQALGLLWAAAAARYHVSWLGVGKLLQRSHHTNQTEQQCRRWQTRRTCA